MLQSFKRCVIVFILFLNNSFQSTSLSQLPFLLNLEDGKVGFLCLPLGALKSEIRIFNPYWILSFLPEEITSKSYLKLQILDNMEKEMMLGVLCLYDVSPCPCRADVHVLAFCLHVFSLSFTAWTVVVVRENIFVSRNCQRWHREAKGMWAVLFCF